MRWGVHSDLSGREWIPAHPPYVEKGFFIDDVPRRVYFHTPWGSVIVGARTQGWLPLLGSMPFRPRWAGWLCWWPIVWSPVYERRIRCRNLLKRWKPEWYR